MNRQEFLPLVVGLIVGRQSAKTRLVVLIISIFCIAIISWQNGNLDSLVPVSDQQEEISNSVIDDSAHSSVVPNSTTSSASANSDVLGSQTDSTLYTVVKVRDGDTIEVEYQGKVKAVRLVGIDAPESVNPRTSVECFGASASARLKQLVEGKAVGLESDDTQNDTDRYGRLLRFVFLNEADIGLQLITEGLAEESLYSSTPHKYRETYLNAQDLARSTERGLWADGVCRSEKLD